MRKIYLDYAATTPLDPAVRRAMEPYFGARFGNPSSLHAFGQEAVAAVDHARETIAVSLGAQFREIIFTGSATEANNLAIRGIAKRFMKYDLRFKNGFINRKSKIVNPRVVISAIEHESVRETARDLEKDGAEVVEIPVNREGVVDVAELTKALNDRTVLVSVMYANNEIGTVQPLSKIAKIIKDFSSANNESATNLRIRKFAKNSLFVDKILFHTDAVQAFQFLDCDVKRLGVDMLTLSAHKIYGPKGAGALYVRQREHGTWNKEQGFSALSLVPCPLSPIITGGGQEFGLRSGTENMPGIVGFGEAVKIAARMRAGEAARVAKLRAMLWQGVKKIFPRAEVNGISSDEFRVTSKKSLATSHSPLTLPNILNVYFPNHLAEELLVKLDLAGVAVSAGPACGSRAAEPSKVIRALWYSAKRARESIRFSLGRFTTEGEIQKTLHIMKRI
ncbi:MAG: cysteine desulfurase [Candidatus Liptonbacteria bacterium]|nr:cysteine desulfurase [Candidatus Liptonbacteria bacterium]